MVAIPAELPELDDDWRAAFSDAVVRAQECGMRVKAIDLSSFLSAAKLLYDDALVAERADAVGISSPPRTRTGLESMPRWPESSPPQPDSPPSTCCAVAADSTR